MTAPKKKNKTIAIVLAVILGLAFLSAIGGGNDAEPETTTTTAQEYGDYGYSDGQANSSEDSADSTGENTAGNNQSGGTAEVTLNNIPNFSSNPYVVINNNQPTFGKSDYTTKSYEHYSALDSLGRCGVVEACIGIDLMPTDERGSIGQVKPSGWQTVKYDFVDGKYLYNRCHLIGWQLTGENANECNLITGTRYMNVEGMLPFENMVADYIKETGNHVMYRVAPIFKGNELVARGVTIEAYSVEDDGEGVCFYVYCYNNQPNITIDYATGKSSLAENEKTETTTKAETTTKKETTTKAETTTKKETTTKAGSSECKYVLNTKTKKYHYPDCASAKKISDENRSETDMSSEELEELGYSPCKNCDP